MARDDGAAVCVCGVGRAEAELLASLISPAQAATAGYKAPQMARAGVQMMDNLASAPTMARMGQRGAIETNLGKMVAPQDEALRVAQANAAKPVSEGGLGLRPSMMSDIWSASIVSYSSSASFINSSCSRCSSRMRLARE